MTVVFELLFSSVLHNCVPDFWKYIIAKWLIPYLFKMDALQPSSKNKCCVVGCTDRTHKRHRFPKDAGRLLQKWVENIKTPVLQLLQPQQIYKSYYVCDKHFADEYLVPGTKRGLRKDAIPTLHLSLSSEELHERCEVIQSTSQSSEQQVPVETICEVNVVPSVSIVQLCEVTEEATQDQGECNCVSFQTEEGFSLNSGSSQLLPTALKSTIRRRRGILKTLNVTRQTQLTPQSRNLYKMVKNWSVKTSKLQSRVKNLKQRLVNAERVAKYPNFTNFIDSLNETTYTFIMQQIRNQQLPPKARRFTLDEKILSLSLFKASPKGYRLLAKIFCFPSQRTLRNMLNNVSYRPGVNQHIFNSLKVAVSKLRNANDKLCALVFDEMTISFYLHYNRKGDWVDGIMDLGYEWKPNLTDHANVFMLKGINRQ